MSDNAFSIKNLFPIILLVFSIQISSLILTNNFLTVYQSLPSYQPAGSSTSGSILNSLILIFPTFIITSIILFLLRRKSFLLLEEQGGKIVRQITYPDHYIYTENDLLTLAETANKTKSILVSTQKDNVRIPKPYRSLVNTLEGEIVFENEDSFIKILTNHRVKCRYFFCKLYYSFNIITIL